MRTMQPLTSGEPPAPVFIHLPCLEVVAWNKGVEDAYGPVSQQSCDRCETESGGWLRVWVEKEEK